jgi:hypothetical protein
MAIKINKKNTGEAFTNTAILDNKEKTTISEDSTSETVKGPGPDTVDTPDDQLAKLNVEAAFTKNLGNYQSARVTVGLTLPSPLDELDSRFDFATTWVNTKLEGLLADIGE